MRFPWWHSLPPTLTARSLSTSVSPASPWVATSGRHSCRWHSFTGSRAHEPPKDTPVYLVCASGNRSLAMTNVLVRAGYDAYSVIGGTGAWTSAGHPVVMGSRRNAA